MQIKLENNFEIEIFEDGTFEGKTPDGRTFVFLRGEHDVIWIESATKDGLGRGLKRNFRSYSPTEVAVIMCNYFRKERKATTCDKIKEELAQVRQARDAITVASLIISGIEGGLRQQMDEMDAGIVIGDIVESGNRQYEVIGLRDFRGLRGRLIRLDGELGTQTKYLGDEWKRLNKKGPIAKSSPTPLYVIQEIPTK